MFIIRVTGNVIGVGYRAMTHRLANELHLKGYVRNMPDDSVEIGVDGTRNDVNELIAALKNAGFTHIDGFDVREEPANKSYSSFDIAL